MSLNFNWSFFDIDDLKARCKDALTESIAQTRRPPVISGPIRVVNIEFGTKPPDLAFNSFPAMSLSRTHIIFALKYEGDASLTLETAVQANPLRESMCDPEFPDFVKPAIVGALDTLVLPFRMSLQKIVLDTLIDVVYTPQGVVVNFHEEPLKHIESQSSLDMIPGVNSMISSVLKKQLTSCFYEDIPESIWTSSTPTKLPPDPFFGARRWSQHLKSFYKLSSVLRRSFGFDIKSILSSFSTLALNTYTPDLNSPLAILSRACLHPVLAGRTVSRDIIEITQSDAQSQLSLYPKSVTSLRSSMSHKSKPKRRVISLKQLSNALLPKNDLALVSQSSHTIGQGSQASSIENPKTPLLQSTEFALSDVDTDEDLAALSSLHTADHTLTQRRFSTPEATDFSKTFKLPKHRTNSLQSSKSISSLTSTPKHMQSVLKSPNRLPSTNDLMRNGKSNENVILK